MEARFLLVCWVLAACCCHLQPTSAGDVAFINSTDLCVDGQVPSGVDVISVTNNSAVINWDPLIPVPSNNVRGYEILYWPEHSSDFSSEMVGFTEDETVVLRDLRPFTPYLVAVRVYCDEGRAGLASPTVHFTTVAIGPSVAVTNVSVVLVDNENKVNITWKPLEAGHWNGIPFGYYVYLFMYSQESECAGTPMALDTYYTDRSNTHTSIGVDDFCYRVIVFAVNHMAWGPGSNPLYFTFTKLPRTLTVIDSPPSSSATGTRFLSSPYVYIIVAGVVAVVPIVLGIVLCKKARERKRKVQYCRGVNPFGDIQMDPMSPASSGSHLSPHASNSRAQAFSPLSNHSPVTPSRPLLASPMPPQTGSDHSREAPPHFTMPPPVHSPTNPQSQFQQQFQQQQQLKGGTSYMTEGPSGANAAFMSRNFNLEPAVGGDVFCGGGGVGGGAPPPMRPGPHRPRANTEGGGNMPNPYEFPVHPGGASTLPRTELGVRSNGGGVPIPPPPNHAPPPLTQSSLEIFARVSRSPPHNGTNSGGREGMKHGDPHGGRGMSHRSFSTTHAPGLSSPTSTVPPPNSNSMRMIRSASLLHPVEEREQDGGPDYATVEPLDEIPRGRAATLDRYPPPPPPPPQQQQQQQFHHTTRATRGSMNSDDLSSFSEMTADNDSLHLSSVQGHIPPPPNYAPRHPKSRPGDQRESVFSETSTEEPSISSGSIREASPPPGAPGWLDEGTEVKKRLSSSSTTPTNSRTPSYNQAHHHPPASPS